MTTFQAFILGLIQGLTEFFPISSSGHLQLTQMLFGWQNLENYILFNLVCHVGTLMAIFCLLSQQIRTYLADPAKCKQIALAILPLFPLLLILKPLKAAFGQPEFLGSCFIVTALLLFLGERWAKVSEKPKTWRDSVIIGCSQAIALLPGISRSGSTISSARLMGWSANDAVTFSFLLAIPTILGGVVVESYQLLYGSTPLPEIGLKPYLVGFFASFIFGYMALQGILRLVRQNKMWGFALYCLVLGLLTTWYFHG